MTYARFALMSCLALCLMSLAVLAKPMPSPSGPVLLTVSGAIGNTNGDGIAEFDLEMLSALGEAQIVTETIWTEGEHRFSGVRLDILLEHLGIKGDTLSATAINDYSVRIPVSDATQSGPIIAYALDGKPLSRREKGPLWLIYPYSSSSDYRTEVIYSRSIWQLDRMTVEE